MSLLLNKPERGYNCNRSCIGVQYGKHILLHFVNKPTPSNQDI